MSSKIGTNVKLIQPSKHAGVTGKVFKDYGSMLIVKLDDTKYPGSWKMLGPNKKPLEGKYLQVRADCAIQTE